MEFEKELLEIVNDKENVKMSKKATMLLSHLYTLEEKKTVLKKRINDFISDVKKEEEDVELTVKNNVIVKKKKNKDE